MWCALVALAGTLQLLISWTRARKQKHSHCVDCSLPWQAGISTADPDQLGADACALLEFHSHEQERSYSCLNLRVHKASAKSCRGT